MPREQHPYPRVETWTAGMVRVHQAQCKCGWKGPEHDQTALERVPAGEYTTDRLEAISDAEKQACNDGYHHYERNRLLTVDDIDWLAGTGRYAQ